MCLFLLLLIAVWKSCKTANIWEWEWKEKPAATWSDNYSGWQMPRHYTDHCTMTLHCPSVTNIKLTPRCKHLKYPGVHWWLSCDTLWWWCPLNLTNFPLSSWILLVIMAVLWAWCCVRWAWSDPSCISVSSWVALFVTKSQPIRGLDTDTWPIRGQYCVRALSRAVTASWELGLGHKREGRWMETQGTRGGSHAY